MHFVAAAVASAFVDDLLDVVAPDTDNNHHQQQRQLLAFCYSSCSFDFGKLYVGIASSHTLYCHPKLRKIEREREKLISFIQFIDRINVP